MSNSFLSGLTAELARVGPTFTPLRPTRRDFFGAGIALLTAGCAPRLSPNDPSRTRAPLALTGGDMPSSVQPLDPAIPWDWPSTGPGQISLQQFNFCDTQPASSRPGSSFSFGAGSFSDAYLRFLDLAEATSRVPASMVTSTRKAAMAPTFPPSAGAGPPGWVAVPNSGGVLEFKPEWAVAITPGQWAIDQIAGFHLAAGATAGFLRGTPQAAAFDVKRRDAVMEARSLVRIQVAPGAWYSDSFVRLAASGPFAGARSAEEVVGPNGILRCRVTEFFVATELSASVTLDDAEARALAAHLAAAPTAKIGSLAAGDTTLRATRVAGGTCVEATAVGKSFIIAASVEPVLARH